MALGNIGRPRIKRDVALDVLLGQCGHARRNLAVNRDVVDPDFLYGRDQGARFAGVALEKPFPLESGEVLHHRSLTGETKMALDLPRARRDSFLALLALDEIEDALLSLRQHELSIGAPRRRCKFK